MSLDFTQSDRRASEEQKGLGEDGRCLRVMYRAGLLGATRGGKRPIRRAHAEEDVSCAQEKSRSSDFERPFFWSVAGRNAK